MLDDPEVDAVIIATRHNLHATMALAALRGRQARLLEKPLALDGVPSSTHRAFFAEAGSTRAPILLTGFNRRFSPHARRIARARGVAHATRWCINYRMNAGYIPLDHWVARRGGRRPQHRRGVPHLRPVHLPDRRARRTTSRPSAIRPTTGHYSSQDNFAATISFDDGSVATLTYTALGSKDYPKEQLEVFVDGKVIALDDYQSLDRRPARRRRALDDAPAGEGPEGGARGVRARPSGRRRVADPALAAGPGDRDRARGRETRSTRSI